MLYYANKVTVGIVSNGSCQGQSYAIFLFVASTLIDSITARRDHKFQYFLSRTPEPYITCLIQRPKSPS